MLAANVKKRSAMEVARCVRPLGIGEKLVFIRELFGVMQWAYVRDHRARRGPKNRQRPSFVDLPVQRGCFRRGKHLWLPTEQKCLVTSTPPGHEPQ